MRSGESGSGNWPRYLAGLKQRTKLRFCYSDSTDVLRLAEAREADHPEEAISIYATQLSRVLQPAQQQAYEAAVNILRKIRQVKSRIGKEFEFGQFVRSIREQYKARRNLMKLLDAEGW